jgi:hypothetical protein
LGGRLVCVLAGFIFGSTGTTTSAVVVVGLLCITSLQVVLNRVFFFSGSSKFGLLCITYLPPSIFCTIILCLIYLGWCRGFPLLSFCFKKKKVIKKNK